MKNKIEDLRNHMFAAIEELNEMDLMKLEPEERKAAIDRAKAIASLGSVIVNSVKTEVEFFKAGGKKGLEVMGNNKQLGE